MKRKSIGAGSGSSVAGTGNLDATQEALINQVPGKASAADLAAEAAARLAGDADDVTDAELAQAVSDFQASINAETQARQAGDVDDVTITQLTQESANRQTADGLLDDKINQEIVDSAAADALIDAKVEQEIRDRIAGDTDEANLRQNQVDALTARLATEETTRASEDALHVKLIDLADSDAIEAGTAGKYIGAAGHKADADKRHEVTTIPAGGTRPANPFMWQKIKVTDDGTVEQWNGSIWVPLTDEVVARREFYKGAGAVNRGIDLIPNDGTLGARLIGGSLVKFDEGLDSHVKSDIAAADPFTFDYVSNDGTVLAAGQTVFDFTQYHDGTSFQPIAGNDASRQLVYAHPDGRLWVLPGIASYSTMNIALERSANAEKISLSAAFEGFHLIKQVIGRTDAIIVDSNRVNFVDATKWGEATAVGSASTDAVQGVSFTTATNQADRLSKPDLKVGDVVRQINSDQVFRVKALPTTDIANWKTVSGDEALGWYDASTGPLDANALLVTVPQVLIGFDTTATLANMPLNHTTDMSGFLTLTGDANNGRAFLFVSEHKSPLGLGIWYRDISNGGWTPWRRFSEDTWRPTDNIVGTLAVPVGSRIILADGKQISLSSSSDTTLKAIRIVPRTDWENCLKPLTSDPGYTVQALPASGTQEVVYIPNHDPAVKVWEEKSVKVGSTQYDQSSPYQEGADYNDGDIVIWKGSNNAEAGVYEATSDVTTANANIADEPFLYIGKLPVLDRSVVVADGANIGVDAFEMTTGATSIRWTVRDGQTATFTKNSNPSIVEVIDPDGLATITDDPQPFRQITVMGPVTVEYQRNSSQFNFIVKNLLTTAIPPTDVLVDDQSASGYMDVGDMRMQWGSGANASSGTQAFPQPFSNTPVVTATTTQAPGHNLSVLSLSTTQFTWDQWDVNNTQQAGEWNWFAIGLKP